MDTRPAAVSLLLGLLEKRRERLWSFLGRNPRVQNKIPVTQGPGACAQAPGQRLSCWAQPGSECPRVMPPGSTWPRHRFLLSGDSQDRQLSTPSHTLPDPRRKQRDTDTWTDFFPPFLLGQVSIALNSNSKANSDSGGPWGRNKSTQTLPGMDKGQARLCTCRPHPV